MLQLIDSQVQTVELELLIELDRICRENGLRYSLAYGTVLGAVRHKGFIPWDLDIDIMVNIEHYQEFCRVLRENLSESFAVYSYETEPGYEFLFARLGYQARRYDEFYLDIFPMVGLPKSSLGRWIYSRVAYLIFRGYFIKRIERGHYAKEPRKRWVALLAKLAVFPLPARFFVWCYEGLQRAFPVETARQIYNFCGIYRTKEIMPKGYLLDLTELEFEGRSFPVPKDWDGYLRHIYGDYMTPRKTNYV